MITRRRFSNFVLSSAGVVGGGASSLKASDVTSGPLLTGVSAHVGRASRAVIDQTLRNAKALGVSLLRWEMPWRVAERQGGELEVPENWNYIVDYGAKIGIQSQVVLDYGNPLYDEGRRPLTDSGIAAFSDYAEFIVGTYSSMVETFEIWNEWDAGNGESGRGSPNEYMKLLSTVYPRLKSSYPDSIFVADGGSRYGLRGPSGGKNSYDRGGYFKQLANLGIHKLSDGVSVHPYTNLGKTTQSRLAEFCELVSGVDQTLREAGAGDAYPIHITEIGWRSRPGSSSRDVTEMEQAELLESILRRTASRRYSGAQRVHSILFYQLQDPPVSQSDSGYGLFSISGTLKPAGSSLASWNRNRSR